MDDLRVRAEVTLSNLVVASKTHARNFTACIRKTSRMEQDEFAAASNTSLSEAEAFTSRRIVDAFGSSSPSPSPAARIGDASQTASGRFSEEDTRRLPSEPSSSDMNSPLPIFDHPLSRTAGGILNDDSCNADGSEDACAELKTKSAEPRLRPSAFSVDVVDRWQYPILWRLG
ncbi:hypothetical protein PILCRDRAFT_4519 [Piloderma croceum F 1598]|uniref:Uncharacterized protein n=1 Tax=Piloderma croceum (strain F 1598) TaxID=765440 RepID=A0A0C3G7I1_PILCF|nr:hypothetical protein PILCRDRAFT_4519 [Piloderma croceum F 1598]